MAMGDGQGMPGKPMQAVMLNLAAEQAGRWIKAAGGSWAVDGRRGFLLAAVATAASDVLSFMTDLAALALFAVLTHYFHLVQARFWLLYDQSFLAMHKSRTITGRPRRREKQFSDKRKEKVKSGHGPQRGALHQDILTDRPSVVK
jgi:hypothetical protein